MTPESGLKLTSLNIEGDLHLKLALPFLKLKNSDVICLQEVLEKDIPVIKDQTDMNVVHYAPLVHFTGPNKARMPNNAIWGLLYLVKKDLRIKNLEVKYYKKRSTDIPAYKPGNPNSVDRTIIASTIIKNGIPYRVITTHFTWSPNGQPVAEQERDMNSLLNLLENENEFILCGDTNAPRGGSIWQMLASKYKDNVPQQTKTTLFRPLHKAGDIIGDYVVDCLFSTPSYRVKDVEVTGGVSDHMAVSGTIFNTG